MPAAYRSDRLTSRKSVNGIFSVRTASARRAEGLSNLQAERLVTRVADDSAKQVVSMGPYVGYGQIVDWVSWRCMLKSRSST